MPYSCTNCGETHQTGELCPKPRETMEDVLKAENEMFRKEIIRLGGSLDKDKFGKIKTIRIPTRAELKKIVKEYTGEAAGAVKHIAEKLEKKMKG